MGTPGSKRPIEYRAPTVIFSKHTHVTAPAIEQIPFLVNFVTTLSRLLMDTAFKDVHAATLVGRGGTGRG